MSSTSPSHQHLVLKKVATVRTWNSKRWSFRSCICPFQPLLENEVHDGPMVFDQLIGIVPVPSKLGRDALEEVDAIVLCIRQKPKYKDLGGVQYL